MKLIKCIFLVCLISYCGNTFAQAPVDSTYKIHSVKKATIASAILPGAGQVYNKKIWKVPIIYAAFAGMGYLIKFNNDYYKDFNNALIARLDNDSSTVDDKYENVYSDENLRALSDNYRRNRDLSILLTVLIYGLNIVDAHVDAHLFYFNVSDDLSMEVKPMFQLNAFSQNPVTSAGINLSLHF